jgi:hypothetical protein
MEYYRASLKRASVLISGDGGPVITSVWAVRDNMDTAIKIILVR